MPTNIAIGHCDQADHELGLRSDIGIPLKTKNRRPADCRRSQSEYVYCGKRGATHERSNPI